MAWSIVYAPPASGGGQSESTLWPNGTVTAASASQADVQTAVNSASDGQIVLIPNGSATWTGGITTTKQILIRAQNTTATPAGCTGSPNFTVRTGATTRNVTITNNSSSALFSMTSGNTYHVGIAGVAFYEGTSTAPHVYFTGSGSKIPLLRDCYLHCNVRRWPDDHALNWSAKGGVMWNCVLKGNDADHDDVGEGAFLMKPPGPAWTTASTMGDADSDGTTNMYAEDCSFINCAICPDIDDLGRFVARYCLYDGAWAETHGFTSAEGGRHWEFYHNRFQVSASQKNMGNRYFWCRMGTGVFTNNRYDEQPDPGYYGHIYSCDIGDNVDPVGTYMINRQPGCGHNGSAYVSDPIYSWNNSGTLGSANVRIRDAPDWTGVVHFNRDVYVDAGAKAGYTSYTYPHPLRST